MHRKPFLDLLTRHTPLNLEETRFKHDIDAFVRSTPACFERSWLPGHITGSAWILDRDLKKAVLVHHTKLGRWLQPGGHADGDNNLAAVALKEAWEETGLEGLVQVSNGIYDLDVHQIPAKGNVPAHLHYDIRFAFMCTGNKNFRINHESREILWVPLDKIKDFAPGMSVGRMVWKTSMLKTTLVRQFPAKGA